jgi:hypothetical protein
LLERIHAGSWFVLHAPGKHRPDMGENREIDALVDQLYGLTEEEIAIVEGRDH